MKKTLIALLFSLGVAHAQGTVNLPCGTGATQLVTGLTTSTYIDTTPADGAVYSYVVTANDLGGATCSNILSSITIPATGTHTVTLNWTPSVTQGVTYGVFRAAPPAQPTNPTATVN